MLKRIFAGALALVVSLGCVTTSYAIFGIGVHYDIDGSVKMPDAQDEQLTFDNLSLNANAAGFTLPGTQAAIGPEDIPIFFDRTNFSRTPFGLGGKIYIDIFPLIDCIEFGGDIAAWEYDGVIRYPTSIAPGSASTFDPSKGLVQMALEDLITVQYDTLDMSLEANGVNFPGISGVPFVKLNMGVTIRKYIPLPIVKRFIKPYVGAGLDVHFATPVPSAGLISDALGEALNGNLSIDSLSAVLASGENQKAITQEILNRLMTPHFGMNILVGTMIKPPVIPFGIYVDGRLMIPFGPLDEDAEVTGVGIKLNAGVVLHIGKSAD